MRGGVGARGGGREEEEEEEEEEEIEIDLPEVRMAFRRLIS